jgi:hypothetical protein
MARVKRSGRIKTKRAKRSKRSKQVNIISRKSKRSHNKNRRTRNRRSTKKRYGGALNPAAAEFKPAEAAAANALMKMKVEFDTLSGEMGKTKEVDKRAGHLFEEFCACPTDTQGGNPDCQEFFQEVGDYIDKITSSDKTIYASILSRLKKCLFKLKTRGESCMMNQINISPDDEPLVELLIEALENPVDENPVDETGWERLKRCCVRRCGS